MVIKQQCSRSTQQQSHGQQPFNPAATSSSSTKVFLHSCNVHSKSRDVQPQIQWLAAVIREPHLSQLQLHVIEEAIKGVTEKQNKGRKGGAGNSLVGRLNKAFGPTGVIVGKQRFSSVVVERFGFALGFTFVFQQSDFAFVERGYGVGGVEVLGLEVVGERKRVVAAKWDVGKGGWVG
ncbi:hypothetical protein ACLOJK_027291 [Asimina triloba]